MSCNDGTNYIESRCSKSHNNKLEKFIKDCQNGTMTLPGRQFNCPPCITSQKSSCHIPLWIKSQCDDMKCFNCPPKYLCFDENDCHLEELKQKSK